MAKMKRNQGMLGKILIFVGAAFAIVAQFAFPLGSTQCNNGVCVTTATPLAYYALAGVGAAIFVLGVLMVYVEARPRFRTMHP